jgi:hypothetical protein
MEEGDGRILDHAKHRIFSEDLVLVLHDSIDIIIVLRVLLLLVNQVQFAIHVLLAIGLRLRIGDVEVLFPDKLCRLLLQLFPVDLANNLEGLCHIILVEQHIVVLPGTPQVLIIGIAQLDEEVLILVIDHALFVEAIDGVRETLVSIWAQVL